MLRRAISCFLSQTYRPRELLVFYQSDDHATRDYLAGLGEPSVRPVEIPCSPRLSTGLLRNVSLQAACGHYVATWDDDDWYGPTRLAEQISAIVAAARPGCVLSRLVLYDKVTQSAFLSAKRTWENSLVAERTAVPSFPDLRQGSDTHAIARMLTEAKLVALDHPELYVYVYHGGNLWNRAHWEANLLKFAHPLAREDSERVRSRLTPEME
jgi:glycosyltransferase involved in cell wall biosynthesis